MYPRTVAGAAAVLFLTIGSLSSAEIVEAIALDVPPERTQYQPPMYPEATEANQPVDVRLTAIIRTDGSIGKIESIDAPDPAMANAARAAVERWRFRPGTVQAEPVSYRLTLTVPFRVREDVDADRRSLGEDLEEVSTPTVEWQIAPAYPAEFASEPRDAVAMVNVLVDAVGTPSDAVVEYATHEAFARNAREAVLGWKFAPAEADGKLVSARTQVMLRFRKEDAQLSANDRKQRAQLEQALDYDQAPDALIQVPLVYPYEALMQQQRGLVSLNLLVSPEGQIVKIEPDMGVHPEFAMAASACVSCWTFRPATKLQEPVFGWVKWEMVFTDDSGEFLFDDVSRELLAALRAGTFKPARPSELDRPVAVRERIAPKMPPGHAVAPPGDALIEVIVDRNGRVQFPRIVRAASPALGYAAATAALRWRFEPPRRKGEPVDVRVGIPFQFVPAEPEKPADAPASSTAAP